MAKQSDQLSKIEKPRLVRLIRKSNDLVEGKYRFDIWEMRVFTKTLTMIHKDDEDFRPYRIYLKEIISDFGLEQNKQSYKFLKEGAEKLARREIRAVASTPDGEMELLTHIAAGVKSFTNNNVGKYIEISFHPEMKPHLLQLQTQFLMYDIKNILRLQSSFSIRIYELLKQYERIGKRKFTIEELKEILDISDKYPLYANFKQRVIIKAQEDLSEFTDIRFTFEEEKKGKAVYAIIFFIERNADFTEELPSNIIVDSIIQLPVVSKESQEALEIFSLLKEFKGVNIQTVKDWLTQFSPEHVRQRITLLKNQIALGGKIRNPMGYLQKMMIQSNLFDLVEETKQEKQQVAEQQKQNHHLLKRLAAELEQLQVGHYETQKRMVDKILSEDETLRTEIHNSVKNSRFYDPGQTIAENMKKGMVQGMVFSKVKQARQTLFEEMDREFEVLEKSLKSQLRVLGWDG
ncbi:replication initiation protein [Runella salmonicolor]|uniref:Replication initiation protein n=1 Tax=Runella salmonicolor TaxID=2950278 RepID=A0ABT1FX94_9BACT|nr:replication initiation protein [Runella salmonicolor]MCP1386321.1 replication initiation protein [Runella salmonicolor]